MFRRILLCYDGASGSRAVLQRGLDLGLLLDARIHVLAITAPALSNPVLLAAAVGTVCVADDPDDSRALLSESIDWLRAHGVEASGQIAHGGTVEQIASYAKKLGVDLIVLRRYPPASSDSWWSSGRSGSLAERANCCVMVAVDVANAPTLPRLRADE